MQFDDAIKVHTGWRTKLSTYARKPDGSLKAAEVAVDSKCDLGKWLVSEGQKYSQLPEFNSLRTDHTRFHKAAAEVIKKADSGQDVTKDMALGADSEFGKASSAVVTDIMNLRRKLQPAG